MAQLALRLRNFIEECRTRDEGISSIEYGLMAVGIALVMGAAAIGVGDQLESLFSNIETALTP